MMESDYDSTEDTMDHIAEAGSYINDIGACLGVRANAHDTSKLRSPEKEVFDEYTPKLKTLTYGSDEYVEALKGMNKALLHHYEQNRHHPEHFKHGISEMNLMDITEMICDWKAASERHADGDIYESFEINQRRFEYSDEMKQMFINTAKSLGW